MIIDVTPKIQYATELQKVIMETRDIFELYVFKTADGEEFTVQFDKKSFEDFCPSRTVSEMLLSWEDGLIREVELFRNAASKKLHPYWTMEQVVEEATNFSRQKTVTVPQPISRETAKMFEALAKKKEKKIGEIEFVKIVRYSTELNKPCDIFAAQSKDNIRNVKITKETNEFVFWEEVYDSYRHAPSQNQTREGCMKKSKIDFIKYT